MTISAAQCRAGRALLDWSQDRLAESANVSRTTVADFERNTRQPIRNNLVSIAAAMEAAGVAFISDDDQGAGVRFRKVEIEYNNKTVRERGRGYAMSIRYRGEPYELVVDRDALDDLDRATYRSSAEYAEAYANHLPKILIAAKKALDAGETSAQGEIYLSHDAFPPELF
ncbi:helix-turn-helix transcriptional regulator [Marinibaculum pumilum]|uniref:Helix-turn-helix transcriptional regulator n=1 Tax=Marinibaculum pumilum TaxID=1766165 RepID=A0ABV7L7M3_9PROT